MRINKFIALGTVLSRRGADTAIAAGRVTIDGRSAEPGSNATNQNEVKLDGVTVVIPDETVTILFHKPTGCVCSRNGQGNRTIYDLLPERYRRLNPVGRLDKDSSGLLLLTNDGVLAERLTHPRYQKAKIYEVTLDKPLEPLHHQLICDHGIMLDDGLSRFQITRIEAQDTRHEAQGSKPMTHGNYRYEIRMYEGRNRQIRRTLAALGYTVVTLHRTHFGPYRLNVSPGKTRPI